MSRHAWIFIGLILTLGTEVGVWALLGFDPTRQDPLIFIVLTVGATLAQLYKTLFSSRADSQEATISYSPLLVFLFGGVLQLTPAFFVLLVVIPHTIEWIKERWTGSSNLSAWYIQAFNIANHIVVGLAAQLAYTMLAPIVSIPFVPIRLFPAMVALLLYLLLNHSILGRAITLARGVSWHETGLFTRDPLVGDTIMLCLGYTLALSWSLHPLLIVPALAPLVLAPMALMVPQLKKEATIDVKTQLYNAHYFMRLLNAEVERATRFSRPLAFLMADLDLLRNINNTYGHLAGDAVLAGVGEIILKTIREYDIAGRFGGEEFSIAMPEMQEADASAVAERLRGAIASAEFRTPTASTPIQVTISIGIACFPKHATTALDLVHQSDLALYQAKLHGRNQVVQASQVPHTARLSGLGGHLADLDDTAVRAHSLPGQVRSSRKLSDPPNDANRVRPPKLKRYPQFVLDLFVGLVIAAGTVLTLLGLQMHPSFDWITIGFLVVLAVLAERFEVNVYGDTTISVSVAVTFAAALVTGLSGVSIISAAIALTHYFRNRPALYRTGCNWATHVLAGSVPAIAFAGLGLTLHISNWLWLIGFTVVTGLGYYFVETGLLALAIALSTGVPVIPKWRSLFQWQLRYYGVLCVMGLFLVIAYNALGWPGLIVFAMPIGMMHYAEEQYVAQTQQNVQELERLNRELTLGNREIVAASQSIRDLNDELFLTVAKMADARDPYVSGHASQVALYATAIAQELDLSPKQTEDLRQAAFLHDIGKIGIPDAILNKPDKLTSAEYEQLKQHVRIGGELLETSRGLRHLVPFVKYHHEWWNGRGYPDGLHGPQIALEARILALCDAVEAMASDRPYHRANTLDEIISEIACCAGTQFDPLVAYAFIRWVKREQGQSIVNSARRVTAKNSVKEHPFARPRPTSMPEVSPTS